MTDNIQKKANTKNPVIIGIDGDDTLWYTELVYERLYKQVKSLYSKQFNWSDDSFSIILKSNIELIGYGMKAYIISLIEYILSNTESHSELLLKVIKWSKETWKEPIKLYDHAIEAVQYLSLNYNLVLITQGDNAEQQSKINRCGIPFKDIEIFSKKQEQTYLDFLKKRNLSPKQFIMIGNSFKTDVLPVLNIGGKAIYIKSKWQFEKIEDDLCHPNLYRADNLDQSLKTLKKIVNEQY